MKKIMLITVLFTFAVMVNAQEKKETMKETKKTEMKVQKPAKLMISEADLMKPIKDDLAKNFAGVTFEKAFKMGTKDGDIYKVIVMKDNVKWNLEYDKEGKFIKKTEMKKMEAKPTEMKEMKKTEAPKQ
jgi:hypothetical protein